MKTLISLCLAALLFACAAQQSDAENADTAPVDDGSAQKLMAHAATEISTNKSSANTARRHQLQLGLGATANYNMEYPFLNIAKSTHGWWQYTLENGEKLKPGATRERGFVDRQTGLPGPADGAGASTICCHFITGIDKYPDYHGGDYVLEWDGAAQANLYGQPKELTRHQGPKRIYFTMPGGSNGPRGVTFNNIQEGGVTDIRLYRAEHEKLLQQGKIWNPEFIDYVKRYDVLRTMDMQNTNNSPIRSFSEVASLDAPSWGSTHMERNLQWPAPAYYSIPYEALFDLGVETGRAIWLHIPPQIGSPKSQYHPSLLNEEENPVVSPEKLRAHSKDNAAAILESEEWDIFASAFVARLIASDYPASRPLYIEIGNEIWNFAGGFVYSTNYAWGIGEGYFGKGGPRQGYGVLTGRWMIALEKAMAAAEVDYNVKYVIASHTAWAERTRMALDALRDYLRRSDIDADAYMARTGVALTTYHGNWSAYEKKAFGEINNNNQRRLWEERIKNDPQGLSQDITDHFINGDADDHSTRNWVLKNWRAHREIAESFGVKIMGAYEGGSHFNPPGRLTDSKIFRDWWLDYHWGPLGAEVTRRVNEAVLAEFPDTILSNFQGMGVIGGQAPWFDGHYETPTPMLEMWEQFAIPPQDR